MERILTGIFFVLSFNEFCVYKNQSENQDGHHRWS